MRKGGETGGGEISAHATATSDERARGIEVRARRDGYRVAGARIPVEKYRHPPSRPPSPPA